MVDIIFLESLRCAILYLKKGDLLYSSWQFKGESSVTEKKLSFATAELVIPSSSVGKLVKYSPPK